MSSCEFLNINTLFPLDKNVSCSTDTAQTCSNGVAGHEGWGMCCPVGCGYGRCGGGYCRSFGGDDDVCCTTAIEDSGIMCSESGAAPCIIDPVVGKNCAVGDR